MNKKPLSFITRLIKLRRVSTAFIIATALLAAVIIFVTIYASQVGNFVISVSNGQLELYLSEEPQFLDPQTALTAPGIKDLDNTTLSWIDTGHIRATDANSSTKTYLGYSFYLKNYTGRMINYNIRMSIDETYKNIDRAVWVMVIEERPDSETQTIYSKRQTQGDNIGEPETCIDGQIDKMNENAAVKIEKQSFLSDMTIFDYNVERMRADETVRYTFILWLEGNDADCDNSVLEGTIRCSLKFVAY